MDAPSCAYEIEHLFYEWQQERSISMKTYEDSLNMQTCSNAGYESKITELKSEMKTMYSEEEAGELVYTIIGQYAKDFNIMIDGGKLNKLFKKFKKKRMKVVLNICQHEFNLYHT